MLLTVAARTALQLAYTCIAHMGRKLSSLPVLPFGASDRASCAPPAA